jgi:hypothetical protein
MVQRRKRRTCSAGAFALPKQRATSTTRSSGILPAPLRWNRSAVGLCAAAAVTVWPTVSPAALHADTSTMVRFERSVISLGLSSRMRATLSGSGSGSGSGLTSPAATTAGDGVTTGSSSSSSSIDQPAPTESRRRATGAGSPIPRTLGLWLSDPGGRR